MKTVDFSGMIVMYNFVIGVLLVLSSGKIASYVGVFGARTTRYASVSISALGGVWALLAGSIYVLVHQLGFGM